MPNKNDHITRRDFLNGTQIAIGSALISPWASVFGTEQPKLSHSSSTVPKFSLDADYYPPAKTGLRGSHVGSWETMHARVMGQEWGVDETSEHYDLVVIGAGLSGLSAAYFYRQQHPDARILILDNHDDFGGHAKRNEFEH